jgi:hypothetical protein
MGIGDLRPNCRILLVEASSASLANLGTAVNRAVTMGAKYVQLPYGGGDSAPSSAASHPGRRGHREHR